MFWKREEIIEGNIRYLRNATKEEQYKELIRYGSPIVDIEKTDINGHLLRIFVFDYYDLKWFMHLEDGNIVNIQEL